MQLYIFLQNRSSVSGDVASVPWSELATVLSRKFAVFTGARRMISSSDLSYMAEKLMLLPGDEMQSITFHRFAKVAPF